MILTVQPGLSDEAMVEAIQIATEGRVRALYEAGIQSSASNLLATGTGTDCIAIVSLNAARKTYCGKYTKTRRVHRPGSIHRRQKRTDAARKAFMNSYGEISRYPDPYGEKLKAALAKGHGMKSAEVLVGNGSTQLV